MDLSSRLLWPSLTAVSTSALLLEDTPFMATASEDALCPCSDDERQEQDPVHVHEE